MYALLVSNELNTYIFASACALDHGGMPHDDLKSCALN
jgi:hypothetical protein